MDIERNKEIREKAIFDANILSSDLNPYNTEEVERYKKCFLKQIGWLEKRKWSEQPMEDGASKSFGNTTMPFGKFKGRRVDDVPISYLEWVADNVSDFNKNIRRYLMSNRVILERANEDEND